MLSVDQVVERALRQDKFLQDHPASEKAEEVKELYKKYVTFTLFGLNNTPLFDYNTKAMDGDAKDAYTQALKAEKKATIRFVKGILRCWKNSFALTDEVDQYENVFPRVLADTRARG